MYPQVMGNRNRIVIPYVEPYYKYGRSGVTTRFFQNDEFYITRLVK